MSIIHCLTEWFSTNFTIFFYIAAFFGFTFLFKIIVTIFKGIRKLFRKRINFRERYGDGAWALVTGGSEGIGR